VKLGVGGVRGPCVRAWAAGEKKGVGPGLRETVEFLI
jgi:hypothetical protein